MAPPPCGGHDAGQSWRSTDARDASAHANLYIDGGYRTIPTIGPRFLLLSSGSFALAALLLAGGPLVLRLGAVGVAAGALGGFIMSRTVGVAGFVERGLQPAPQALISLITEIGAIALLTAWEVMLRRSQAVPARAGVAVLLTARGPQPPRGTGRAAAGDCHDWRACPAV